jgi:hypothetical protein
LIKPDELKEGWKMATSSPMPARKELLEEGRG